MKYSISIMMCPARLKYKDYLISKLGNATVIMDRGLGLWDTARRSWLSYDKRADYHIVVQDDAIIGKDFYQNLEMTIQKNPNKAYCLYLGNRESFRKESEEWLIAGGVERDIVNWGVAVCLPTQIIEDCMSECDTMNEYRDYDDQRLSKYLQNIGMTVWYPFPSLVDHRWEEKSIMDRNLPNKIRKALNFIGE